MWKTNCLGWECLYYISNSSEEKLKHNEDELELEKIWGTITSLFKYCIVSTVFHGLDKAQLPIYWHIISNPKDWFIFLLTISSKNQMEHICNWVDILWEGAPNPNKFPPFGHFLYFIKSSICLFLFLFKRPWVWSIKMVQNSGSSFVYFLFQISCYMYKIHFQNLNYYGKSNKTRWIECRSSRCQ